MLEITTEVLKKALRDHGFRGMYPELSAEMDKWISNPDCQCNAPLYNTLLSDIQRLKRYFGEDIVVAEPAIAVEPEQINRWQVINCKVDELEAILQGLSHGPKQLAIARFNQDITVVINDPIFN